jgi:hypothetical protein
MPPRREAINASWLPRRSAFSRARALSSDFRARIAAMRSAIGTSRRSAGRDV